MTAGPESVFFCVTRNNDVNRKRCSSFFLTLWRLFSADHPVYRDMALYRRTPAGFAAYLQLGFVLGHDVFDNCQSEPGSSFFPGPCLVHPVEPLGNAPDMYCTALKTILEKAL